MGKDTGHTLPTRLWKMEGGEGKKGKTRFKWHSRFCNDCARGRKRVYSFSTPPFSAIVATANCLLFAVWTVVPPKKYNDALIRDFQKVFAEWNQCGFIARHWIQTWMLIVGANATRFRSTCEVIKMYDYKNYMYKITYRYRNLKAMILYRKMV